MCYCNKSCLKQTPWEDQNDVSTSEGVRVREVVTLDRVSWKWDQRISEADFASRNIPLTTNLISAFISMLFGSSITPRKLKLEKKTKFLSDVSISTVQCVP